MTFSGFYRVNYDKESWYRIIETLKFKQTFTQIHELNRASVIDDLMNLARADYLDYNVALDGLSYLIEETHYVPYKAALNALAYLTKRFAGQKYEDLYKVSVISFFNHLSCISVQYNTLSQNISCTDFFQGHDHVI